MLVQLQSVQIPSFWEVIKFAALQSDKVKEEYQEPYCISLLQDLLSGKKLCFIGQDKGEIGFVFIITFQINLMTGIKCLNLDNLYSFKHQSDENWMEARSDMLKVAVKAECKAVTAESNNVKMSRIADLVGMKEITRKYIYYL